MPITSQSHNSIIRHRVERSSILCLLVLLLSSLVGFDAASQNQRRVTPQIPHANRYQRNRVFLERADSLISGPMAGNIVTYQVLKGNVEFSRGDMHLYCDSAHFYDASNRVDAFGNVRMDRADHLSGSADELHYDGNTEIVTLTGNVSLSKDNRTLTSDQIFYNVRTNTGRYVTGGKLQDPANVLTSLRGDYNFTTEKAEFNDNVQLINDRDHYVMNTSRLLYNTKTHVATLVEPTHITAQDNEITTSSGTYNTVTEVSTLTKRGAQQPKLNSKDGRSLTGDSLRYDRHKQEGYAKGNIRLDDPKHKVIMTGDYGYHNEKTHISYATKRALAKIYNKSNAKPGERSDTLYFHADTLRTFFEKDDTIRVITANNGARFYRKDLQGLSGYMLFSERDSILNLYNHPVVWSGERQVYSPNEINVHMRDSSSVDWVTIPNRGLIVEHLGEVYYNQLSGKNIKAYFETVTDYTDHGDSTHTDLRHADVVGNVKALFYPMENDSTYNKFITSESGYLSVDMKEGRQIDKIKMWPEVSGTVVPIYLAKRSQLYIEEFQWLDNLRPKQPMDVIDISDEMKSMIGDAYTIQSELNEELLRGPVKAGKVETGKDQSK